MNGPPRWLVALLAVAVVGTTVAGAGVVPLGEDGSDGPTGPCVGTVSDPANGTTVISVQGAKGGSKETARLVGVGERGKPDWVHPSGKRGVVWSYDVDPLPNGNLFVTSTVPGDTVVYEFDPQTGERVWEKRFDALDTHDADLINGGEEILLANMRNYDEEAGENNDRIFIYNRTQGEVTWSWEFAEHGYNESAGGEYTEDWTHVNDVDKIAEGQYLVSPRNLDQVIVVNRSTKEIDYRLGSDGETDVLHKQHNPDFLVGPDGRPTMLVADSENDRVVEYTRVDGEWKRTWTLRGNFNWPRDADRLPNGNTLVVDSWNHRVVEVTPKGKVVWETYAPWLVYDAERVKYGDGSRGPTIAEQGANGTYEVHGGDRLFTNDSALAACGATLDGFERDTATPYPGGEPAWTVTATGEDLYGERVESGLPTELLVLTGVGGAIAVLVAALAGLRERFGG